MYFYDQFGVPLVVQVNDDGLLRVMHIPEHPLAVMKEGPSSLSSPPQVFS
jgi:hypothetical protein